MEPLADEDVRALAEAAAEGELPDELAQLLAERTGGNPYFVGEAIRDLRERGALKREHRQVVLVGEASIPAAVQESLQARLDRLDPDARELLTTAAVMGRSFSLPLLERLLPRARLRPMLAELEWRQLVVEERNGAEPEYRFRHGLVREAADGMLVEVRRRELHLRVGEALVELHRDSPAEAYGLLARHFAEADSPIARRVPPEGGRRGPGGLRRQGGDRALIGGRSPSWSGPATRRVPAQMLLGIALTHHLAFDYPAANEAFGEAFARPVPAPVRLEPSERITWAMTAAWDGAVAPGHSWTPGPRPRSQEFFPRPGRDRT